MRKHPKETPTPVRGAFKALLLCSCLLDSPLLWAAGPTVGEVIRLCDGAFAQGFKGVDAAACEWFVAPCACNFRGQWTGDPAWCVPDSEPIDATVTKVLGALRLDPDTWAPAEFAVSRVLSQIYPCSPVRQPKDLSRTR